MQWLPRCAAVMLAAGVAVGCNDAPVEIESLDANSASIQASVSGSPRDLAAMQQIVDTFDEAWTAGDAVTYAGQYANVIEWVGPNGAVLTDPAAITGTYTFILNVLLAGTTRESTIRRVTFLTGTIAVLDIDARVTGFADLPGLVPWQPGILRALERNIVQKRGGVWRIILHQQTFVAPGV